MHTGKRTCTRCTSEASLPTPGRSATLSNGWVVVPCFWGVLECFGGVLGGFWGCFWGFFGGDGEGFLGMVGMFLR